MAYWEFDTKRLSVTSILDHTEVSTSAVIAVLSDKATEYLPDDWQSISQKKQAIEWLTNRIAEGAIGSITVKPSGQCVGFLLVYGFDPSAHSEEVRIGYVLAEPYWGKGLVTELMSGFIHAAHAMGNVATVVAGTSKDNTASGRVLIKNDFVLSHSENETDFYVYRVR